MNDLASEERAPVWTSNVWSGRVGSYHELCDPGGRVDRTKCRDTPGVKRLSEAAVPALVCSLTLLRDTGHELVFFFRREARKEGLELFALDRIRGLMPSKEGRCLLLSGAARDVSRGGVQFSFFC